MLPTIFQNTRLQIFDDLLWQLDSELRDKTTVLNTSDIHEVHSSFLSIIALQFAVPFFYSLSGEDMQRAAIIQSCKLLTRKGTKSGVELAVKTTTGIDIKLSEWFEYGGKPFYFKVNFGSAGDFFTPKNLALIFSVIDSWKNVRSCLECLETKTQSAETAVKIAVGCIGKTRYKSEMYVATPPRLTIIIGTAAVIHTKTNIG